MEGIREPGWRGATSIRRVALALVAGLAISGFWPLAASAQRGGEGHGGGGNWHGDGTWHGSVGAWHGGHWYQGWHGSRFGWWWYVPEDDWYAYDAPVYPYPAYPSAAYPGAPANPYYWYYCQNPAGYYPYIQQCAGPWQPVPAPGG
jgi:hypothetical protein